MIPGLRSAVRKLEFVEVARLNDSGKGEVVFAAGDEALVSKLAAKPGDVVEPPPGEITPASPATIFANVEI